MAGPAAEFFGGLATHDVKTICTAFSTARRLSSRIASGGTSLKLGVSLSPTYEAHVLGSLGLGLEVVSDHELDEAREVDGAFPAKDSFGFGWIAE